MLGYIGFTIKPFEKSLTGIFNASIWWQSLLNSCIKQIMLWLSYLYGPKNTHRNNTIYLRSMLNIYPFLFKSIFTERNTAVVLLDYKLCCKALQQLLVPAGVTRGRVITERDGITACKYRHEHGCKSEHGKVVRRRRAHCFKAAATTPRLLCVGRWLNISGTISTGLS